MRKLFAACCAIASAVASLPAVAASVAPMQRVPPALPPLAPAIGSRLQLGAIAPLEERDQDPMAAFHAVSPGDDRQQAGSSDILPLDAGDWQLTAGYATGRRRQSARLAEQGGDDRRSISGLRLSGELAEAAGGAPFRLSLEGRLGRIRVEDDALVGGGSHVPDARLALVLKRAW